MLNKLHPSDFYPSTVAECQEKAPASGGRRGAVF